MPHRRLVLIVAALLLGGVAFGSWKVSERWGHPAGPAVVDPAELHAQWAEGTAATLTQFDQDQDAAKARDALLALRVNAADKDLHQELVFAFEAWATQASGAEARLQTAREHFSVRASNP
jgi:hypothetical protein